MAQVLFIWLLKFKPYAGNTARDIRAALEVCVVLWWLCLLDGHFRLPREDVGSPFPDAFEATLNGILGSLTWCLATLLMAVGLQLDDVAAPLGLSPVSQRPLQSQACAACCSEALAGHCSSGHRHTAGGAHQHLLPENHHPGLPGGAAASEGRFPEGM